MDLRPDINEPVVLRAADDREYRSRVEDVGPGVLTVARPHDLPAEGDFGPGAELMVTWGSARGVAILPTRLDASCAEGTVALWSLAVTGDGWVEQQRRFVRVPLAGAVTLGPRADRPEPTTVTGHLVDVSEGALRCTVDAATADELLADRVEVTAGFRFGDRDFTLAAHVESRRPAPHVADLAEVVVVFDEPVREADALRKQVYRQQLQARRAKDDER